MVVLRTQLPDLDSPNRVGGELVPNNPQPRPTIDADKHTMDDLRNSVAALNQALVDSKLREQCREDWHKAFKIDTNANVSTLPVKIVATKETGGRPFNSVSIISVGGGNLVVSINGEEAISVAAGDRFTNEIIWSVEAWATTAASGTARLRAGAYAGR